jgi:UDP-glucose 4-epimerase
MKILLTGGIGYIGSHVAAELYSRGHKVFIVDNLSNSRMSTFINLNKLCDSQITFFDGDIRHPELLRSLIENESIEIVMHFAASKSVPESYQCPVKYYENNVLGTISLVNQLSGTRVRSIVFSSTAAVYGEPTCLPVDELHPLLPSSPYARSKLAAEYILRDVQAQLKDINVTILRYFNPIGTHPSSLLFDPSTLTKGDVMSSLLHSYFNKNSFFRVFGADYNTRDGTCIRDYVHVLDLAEAHVLAADFSCGSSGLNVFNLGSDAGTSVFELVRAFENASGVSVGLEIAERRSGDCAASYADSKQARAKLGWSPSRTVAEGCSSALNSLLISSRSRELL